MNTMMHTADISIIGGGVIGLACAVALAEAGARVRVLDARPTPKGASAATTGLLIPPTRRSVNRLTALCRDSAALYADWCKHLAQTTGIDPGYVASGALRLYPRDDTRTGQGAPAYLNPTLIGAVQTYEAAHVQTSSLLRALDARLQALGGQRITAAVTGLQTRRGTVRGIELDTGARIRVSHVLVCAGVGVTRLLQPLGTHIPVTPESGQIVQLGEVPQLPETILLDGDRALVAKADGRLHVAGPGSPEEIQERVAAVLGGGKVISVWQGVRPRVAGGMPVLGLIPGYTNLSVAVGHGKNGFLLAPLTARIIAESCLTA